MDVKYLLTAPRSRCTEKHIKNKFPDEYVIIKNLNGETFGEKLYNYCYNSPEHVCPVCGKQTKFMNFINGFHEYCSTNCSYRSERRTNKIKKTCIDRYGVSNASQLQAIKDKKRQTITKNFGGFGFGSQKISEKSNKTIRERYGVDNISTLAEIKDKKKVTTQKHYGVDSVLSLQENREKAKLAILKKYGNDFFKHINALSRASVKRNMPRIHNDFICYDENGNWIMKCPHLECNKCAEKRYITKQNMYHDRLRWGTETCTHLLEPGKFSKGSTIELFVRDILDRYNINYEPNVRNIITPKELDIYIPLKNLGIEINGLRWHSTEFRTFGDHINKFLLCKQRGIRLLSIWQDWIVNKPQIVESMILDKLGLCSNKIYARKCIIKEIDSKTCNSFLDHNHIQGACKSVIKLGLYYNDELMSVMCFSKRSKLSGSKSINNEEWELIRFCSKLNHVIIGGAGKLLNHFIKNWNPKIITSFSCNDISDGGLYRILGFEEEGINPSYWYVEKSTYKRYHRTTFTKTRIKQKYPELDIENHTETELMSSLPYWRIYDSGTTKWKLNVI